MGNYLADRLVEQIFYDWAVLSTYFTEKLCRKLDFVDKYFLAEEIFFEWAGLVNRSAVGWKVKILHKRAD